MIHKGCQSSDFESNRKHRRRAISYLEALRSHGGSGGVIRRIGLRAITEEVVVDKTFDVNEAGLFAKEPDREGEGFMFKNGMKGIVEGLGFLFYA